MRALWFIAAGNLFLTGCAALSTVPLSSLVLPNGGSVDLHSQTAIRLEEANFVVVKTNLMGQCKGFQLFGLISIVPAQYTKALERLYAQAQVESGKAQTLAHVTVERTSVFVPLFFGCEIPLRA